MTFSLEKKEGKSFRKFIYCCYSIELSFLDPDNESTKHINEHDI